MAIQLQRPVLVGIGARRPRPKPRRDGVARIAIAQAAAQARAIGMVRGPEEDAKRRAALMLAAKANLHVTAEIPKGRFTIIDPDTLAPEERADCPFESRTLVVHPDDLERAIAHFRKDA